MIRQFIGILSFFLFVTTILVAQDGWRAGEMEASVRLMHDDHALILKKLGINGEFSSPNGSVLTIYVTPDELRKLQEAGIKVDVIIRDLNKHSRDLKESGALLGYFNYTTIVALADSLATAFPNICKKYLLGTTPLGRQLGILKISDNVNVNENEPEIMFEGGIHGDEIMGPEVVIRYARDLCLGYGTNTTYTDLVNTREIWLYYLVNPDGYAAVSRYNSNGVDVNRDGGYMWDAEGYSTSPFSQIETKMIRNLQLEHNYVVFTDYHGGTEVISYPWSYKTEPPADVAPINNLAVAYSTTSGYSNLGYGQGYNIMYQIFGSTKDNQYGDVGQVGWSIEITAQKQPPSTQIGQYYGYNVPAITEMIKRSGWGIEGVITDSVTGSPVRASIWINGFFPVYSDPANGDFHKYVLPGTYSVKVKANGYSTKTVNNVVVGSQSSAVVNVQLSPAQNRYAYRVIATQIPSYPYAGSYLDESYTPGIIGAPDSVNYSIGRYGWIIIDMGDTLTNGTGDDFKVWETDGSPEIYYCYVGQTPDGPWISIGQGTGTASFDLGNTSLNKARYLKIEDDGDGQSNAANAGFDIDAIQFLTPPLIADFSANLNTPCPGTSINFTDESTGAPTSWSWTFPGGTPGSSTQQDPSNIQYNTPGSYDVSLTVTNAFSTNTITKTAFINVIALPGAPPCPEGDTLACQSGAGLYTTVSSPTATQYSWSLNPPEAGTTSGLWTTCTVVWNESYQGTAYLKVKESNACGEGPFSDSLAIEVIQSPIVDLGADTIICIPDSITLDAGNPGCSYLWSNGETTQTITAGSSVPGTVTYWVDVLNPDNCLDRDSITISITICNALSEYDNNLLKVYPNPSRGIFTVELSSVTDDAMYSIFNSSGIMIKKEKTSINPLIIDISDYSDGIYLLLIQASDLKSATRLILSR